MNKFLTASFVITMMLGAIASRAAVADTIFVSKDCLGGTCTVTGSGSVVLGRFRVTSAQQFNWEALYTGSPNRFWVSQGGINMASTQLSAAAGQANGLVSLANGLWYISINTALMGPGNYSVTGANVLGDPHITTLDGIHYDFQGAGEFVLLKEGSNFEVQSRMTPVSTASPLRPDPHTGLSSCPSLNTAAAIRTLKHRVTYQPNIDGRPDPSGLQLRIDGKLVSPRRLSFRLSDGTNVVRSAGTGALRVAQNDQSSVKITPHWWEARGLWYLDFDFNPPNGSLGIVGPVGHDAWLPALSDGASVGPQPSSLPERYKALYVTFADSWRVNDSISLFDYAPGTSTKTYTMTSWPPEDGKCDLPFTVPLQGLSEEAATAACKGVVVPHFNRACIQDVMATGDRSFGRGYEVTQGPRKFKIRVPNPEYRPERKQGG